MPADQRAAGPAARRTRARGSRGGRRRRGRRLAAAAGRPCPRGRTRPDLARPLLPAGAAPARPPRGFAVALGAAVVHLVRPRSPRRSCCSCCGSSRGRRTGRSRARAALAHSGAGPADLGGGRPAHADPQTFPADLAARRPRASSRTTGRGSSSPRAGGVARPLPRGAHPLLAAARAARSLPEAAAGRRARARRRRGPAAAGVAP